MTDERFERKLDLRIDAYREFKKDRSLFEAAALMEEALKKGNKLLVFGNGGSAAQSSHFAAELVNRFYIDRKALPAVSLTADIANLTSIANDSDYKYVFSRQIEALGKPGDVAIGISTSGKSPNVLEALKQSHDMGLKTVALCGPFTDRLHNSVIDVIISIQADDTPLIQEMHLFVLHMMAELLEKNFSQE
ncbi:MAG: SIS domain-containing protein [bacterium]|nr:SIS domain-containing protein [bacterium]